MLAALLVALVATAATAPAEVEVGGGSALGGRGPPARRRLVEAISLYDCNVWNALYRCESGGSGRTREACSSGIGCDWETGELPGCSPSGVDLATVTELGARLQAANGDGKIQSKSRSCKGVLGETSCNELTTCQWEAQYNRCFSIQAELVREMAEVGCVVDTSNSWVPRESKLETKFLLPGTSRVDILNGMEKYTGGLNLTDDTYWVALGSVGLFGPAISGLFVFSVMVFLVVRTGFLFCGYSLCPGAKFRSPAYDGPRWCTTRRWAGFITVLMAGATVGTLLCFLGGTLFAAGLTDVIDIMVSTGVDLEGNVTIVESALWQASGVLGDAQYNTSAGTLRNATIDAVKSIKENREAMEIYSKYLLVGVQSISGFMLLLLIGSLPGLLNRRWRHVLLGSILLGFFAVLALWVAASVATVAATFTSDLCAAVRVHLETPLYSDLSEWTECKDEGTVVRDWTRLRQGGADVIDLVNSRLVEFATSLGINPDNFRLMCTPYYSTTPAALCPNNTLPTGYEGKACAAYASGLLLGSDVLYPRRPECPYLEVNRIHVNFPNNFESSVAVGGYSEYRCADDNATTCASAFRMPSSEFDALAGVARVGVSVLSAVGTGNRLASCELVREMFVGVDTNVCPTLNSSSLLLWAGLLTAACCLTCLHGWWCLVLGRHSNRELGRRMTVAELKTVYPLDKTVDGKYRNAASVRGGSMQTPYAFSPMARIMQTPHAGASPSHYDAYANGHINPFQAGRPLLGPTPMAPALKYASYDEVGSSPAAGGYMDGRGRGGSGSVAARPLGGHPGYGPSPLGAGGGAGAGDLRRANWHPGGARVSPTPKALQYGSAAVPLAQATPERTKL